MRIAVVRLLVRLPENVIAGVRLVARLLTIAVADLSREVAIALRGIVLASASSLRRRARRRAMRAKMTTWVARAALVVVVAGAGAAPGRAGRPQHQSHTPSRSITLHRH
jgi:uncharacterized membrane protein